MKIVIWSTVFFLWSYTHPRVNNSINKPLLGDNIKTGSIVTYLFSKKPESIEIEPGDTIPEKVMANLKKYNIIIPINQYENLQKEAREAGLTVQEEIFSKYKFINDTPDEWEYIPLG